VTRRVPALVVSGFLGSGKTTLVRRVLERAQREGVKVALVSNEFGELGIDQALLGRMEEDYVELRGGCVCCRLSDQLVDTLEMLRQRADPDRILIETSGVALPYDVQLNFWRPPVASWIADDAVVVMVNAEQLAHGRDLEGTFEQQVSSADLLVLNKTDLVSEAELPALEARLREIEPDAPILRSVHGDVEPALLFPPDPEGLRSRRRAEAAPPPDHDHEHFVSEEVVIEPGVTERALRARMAALGALRVKGFVETDAGLRVVQGVGARVELHEVADPPPEALVGRVVVIHRGGEPGSQGREPGPGVC
jgi:cobalamin biosynthesis protein CobW